MPLGPYSKVCKVPDDLLSKVFPSVKDGEASDSQTVKLDIASSSGVKNAVEISRKNQGAIAASVEPSWHCNDCGADFSAKVSSDNSVSVKVSGKDVAGVDGLAVELDTSLGGQVELKPKVEFANDTLNASVNVAYPVPKAGAKQEGAKVSAELLFAYENFRVGGAAKVPVADPNTLDASFGAAYVQNDLLAGVCVCWNGAKQNYNVHGVFHHDLASLNTQVVVKGKWDGNASVTVGAQYKVNSSTSAKAKVSQDGVVGLALSTKINSNLGLDLGSQFSLGNLDDQKVAVGLTLSN